MKNKYVTHFKRGHLGCWKVPIPKYESVYQYIPSLTHVVVDLLRRIERKQFKDYVKESRQFVNNLVKNEV